MAVSEGRSFWQRIPEWSFTALAIVGTWVGHEAVSRYRIDAMEKNVQELKVNQVSGMTYAQGHIPPLEVGYISLDRRTTILETDTKGMATAIGELRGDVKMSLSQNTQILHAIDALSRNSK